MSSSICGRVVSSIDSEIDLPAPKLAEKPLEAQHSAPRVLGAVYSPRVSPVGIGIMETLVSAVVRTMIDVVMAKADTIGEQANRFVCSRSTVQYNRGRSRHSLSAVSLRSLRPILI